MNLFDVNVLVYAFRKDSERHAEFRDWLLGVLNGDAAFGLSERVLAGVVRVTTHPRIFVHPSTLREALGFTATLRDHPLCRIVRPSSTHWSLFADLCARAGARGNLITDAWFAALALESGCTWITTDRDFAGFPGLKWRHPLDHEAEVANPA